MAQSSGSTFGTILNWGVIGVAAWWIYETFFATPATAAATTTTSTTPATTVTTTPATPTPNAPAPTPPASSFTVAQIGANLLSTMTNANDSAVTVSSGSVSAQGYVFNYYFEETSVNGGLQNATSIADAVFTSEQLSQTMTFSQYWTPIAAYLQGNLGMSGLAIYRGLGMLVAANKGWIEESRWPLGRGR